MAPRNRQYQTKGKGNINLGAILLGALGGAGTGDIEDVPVGEEDIGLGMPVDTGRTEFRVKSGAKDYSGKGQEAANKANIERQLSEEDAQRTLRTKKAEIPIEQEKETALNKPRLELHKAIGTQTLEQELERRKALNPIEIEQERQKHIMELVKSQGIQPTPENIKKADDLLSGINLSEKAQQGYEGIAKSRLGTATAERGIGIEAKTRPLDTDTATKASQFGNIKAKQDLETQPTLFEQYKKTIPDLAENEYYKNLRNRLETLHPGQSTFDIGTRKPVFSVPSEKDLLMQRAQATLGGTDIKPKIGAVAPQIPLQQEVNTGIQPDPNNPDNVIIIIGGKRVSIPKGTP